MSLLSINGAAILAPENGDHKHQNLVVQPLSRLSVAMQVSTIVTTGHQTRFPHRRPDLCVDRRRPGNQRHRPDPGRVGLHARRPERSHCRVQRVDGR